LETWNTYDASNFSREQRYGPNDLACFVHSQRNIHHNNHALLGKLVDLPFIRIAVVSLLELVASA
jgi:hypothetical protein